MQCLVGMSYKVTADNLKPGFFLRVNVVMECNVLWCFCVVFALKNNICCWNQIAFSSGQAFSKM